MAMPVTTRFAPSPSGPLHLGHAYAATFAADLADRGGGQFLVRIEDIDTARCRPEFEAGIFADLRWLGLSWPSPVRRQSEHLGDYQQALSTLEERDLVYPCFCTRRDIAAEIERSAGAPHGPEGPLYPGLCRQLSPRERDRRRGAGEPHAMRLDHEAALRAVPADLTFLECGSGGRAQARPIAVEPKALGDVVLARKDIRTSYHLAVVVDDAIQGVTDVTRGADLFLATHVHRLLQELLGLPAPTFHHHALVCDDDGKRLAKRSRAHALAALRDSGVTPEEIRTLASAHTVVSST